MFNTIKVSEDTNMHVLLKYDPSELYALHILMLVCRIAEIDPSNTVPHCFSTDYHNLPASIIYQYINNKMSIIIIETGGEYATMAWSRYDDIIVAPRRVYKTRGLRNTDIIMRIAMTWLEQNFSKNARYIVSSFNNTRYGRTQFHVFKTKRFFKTHFKSNPSYLDYHPVCDNHVIFFDTEQLLIYKKLGNYADLSAEKIVNTVKSTHHQI
jgi:hypothetical protein